MRVFVTGAGGFVGGHLLPHLRGLGSTVVGADREVDVTDAGSIGRSLRDVRPDAVVHLAALTSVAESIADPLEAYRVNFLGSLELLAAVRREVPAARVLLVGSSDAYGSRAGDDTALINEDDSLRPESPYARSKAAAEQLGSLAVESGLQVVRIRSFTHTGVGQSDRFVASSFARQVAEIAEGLCEPVLHVGNLDSVRDFLDVRDVVEAYRLLLDPDVPVDVYNVASGRGVAVRALLDELVDLAGVTPRIEIDRARYRPADHRVGNASKLRSTTGWQPRFSLRDTLAALLDDWRARVRADARPATP